MEIVLLIFLLVPVFIFQYTIILDVIECAIKGKESTSVRAVGKVSSYGKGRIQRTSYRVYK